MVITLNIDLMKVDKSKIKTFARKDGTEGKSLDLVIFLKDEKDQYGNNGFVSEQVPKDSPNKGTILGNCRIVGQQPQPEVHKAEIATDVSNDLPF